MENNKTSCPVRLLAALLLIASCRAGAPDGAARFDDRITIEVVYHDLPGTLQGIMRIASPSLVAAEEHELSGEGDPGDRRLLVLRCHRLEDERLDELARLLRASPGVASVRVRVYP